VEAVSLDDWILALHVLSAFAMVSGAVVYSFLLWTIRRTDTPAGTTRLKPVVKVGDVATGIGAGGTIVFGLWLAFSVGGYDVWDPWIVAALILWGVYMEVGRRTGARFVEAMEMARGLEATGQLGSSSDLLEVNRARPLLVGHTLAFALVLVILVDMIWKPGA
jgi:uncharacterized membrane protein